METTAKEKKSRKSWIISDELWEKLEGYIPQHRRDPQRKYQHAPGQGRRPVPARKAGKAVPREYGSGSTIHRRFQEWQKAGFFEKIWALALTEYDELEGIGWEWQSIDGSMVKAPLALESVGKNPTDRGKNGDKTFCSDG